MKVSADHTNLSRVNGKRTSMRDATSMRLKWVLNVHSFYIIACVACATLLSSFLYSQTYNSWTQTNGPFGGTITGIAVNPSNTNEVIISARYNGCFRSTNGGTKWIQINQGLPEVGVTTINPTVINGNTVYIGMVLPYGVYRSVNNGATWSASNGNLPTNITINALRNDPASANTLYAATSGGVFKTVDGGRSWTPQNFGLVRVDVRSVIVHPTKPSTLFIGVASGGIYKSVNSGGTWAASTTGIPAAATVQQIVFDPSNSATIYAATTSGVYKSVDSGVNWSAVNTGLTNLSVRALAITSTTTLYTATSGGGVFKTVNAGTSWVSANSGLTFLSLRSIAVQPGSTTNLFLAADDGDGIFKTVNSAGTWTKEPTDVTATNVTALASNINAVYAISSGNGIFRSSNKGSIWVSASSGITSLSGIAMIATDPSNPNTLYAASIDGVYKTSVGGLGGGAWGLKNTGLSMTNVATIIVHPTTTTTLYAGTSGGGVFRSLNGGDSWSSLNTGIPSGSNITAFVMTRLNPGYMYIGVDASGSASDGVYRTTNGGVSWSQQVSGLGSTAITDLAVDPTNVSNVYAGTTSGVYKTVNAGATWSASTTGITANLIQSVAINPGDVNIIYAGTWDGLFRSTDKGKSWTRFTIGTFNFFVNEITFDAGSLNILYTGMYGSGVLINTLAPTVGGAGTINFGTIAVNASSDQNYVITNKGFAPLNVSGVSIAGTHASQFTLMGGGGSFVLPEMEQRTISIRFLPTSDGVKNGILRLVTDAPGQNPYDVSMTGTGASAKISSNVTSVDFGTVSVGGMGDQSIRITNTGSSPLTISDQSIVLQDFTQFIIIQKAAATINEGLSDIITVRFSPSSGGVKNSTLRIISNATNEPIKDIVLTGTGSGTAQISTSTNTIDYGTVNVGNNFERSLDIQNTGSGALVISSQSIGGLDPSQFIITQLATSPVQPGDKTTLKVLFQPSATGTKNATLKIVSNASNQSTTLISLTGVGGGAPLIISNVNELDFGAVNMGGLAEQSVTITNQGASVLNITGQLLAGVDQTMFTISRLCKNALNPGESDFITVRFSPTSSGVKGAKLRVQSNASNAPQLEVNLTGVGGGVPAIDLTTNSLDFGGVAVNASVQRTVVVKNSGVADLLISSQTISGTDASEFSFVKQCSSTLAGGTSDSIVLKFSPISSGAKSASLQIASNASNKPTETVNLNGTGGGTAQITFSTENVDFGAVVVGSNADQSITVTNTGSNALNITGQSISGTDAGSFTITKLSAALLQPNESDNITVRFSPPSNGAKSAQLKITSDAANTPQKSISLTGVGGSVPAISTSSQQMNFGTINIGSKSEQSVTITNSGLSTLTISFQTILGTDASSFSIIKQSSTTLAAGSSDIITLQFQPLSNGDKQATLRVTSNANNTPTLDIALTGAAGGAPVITLGSSMLDFGLVDYGNSSDLSLTITNSGESNLTISDQVIGGQHASEFFIVIPAASALAAGQTDSVHLRFIPTRNGNRNAQLLIINNDPSPLRDTMIVTLVGVGQRDEEPPQITHVSSNTPVQIGSNVQVQATATDLTSGVGRFEVWYRTGANPWSDANRITFSAGIAEIPGSLVTSEGLDYRIIAEDNAGNIDTSKVGEATYFSVPVIVPASAGGGIATIPGATSSAYRMFSVPFHLTNKLPLSVLAPLASYNIRLWRFFDYRNGNYQELKDFQSDTSRFVPGRGFFLITRTSTLLQNTDGITVGSIDGVIANTVSIPGWQLQAGWNIVGNPFGFDINRGSLRLQNGDTLKDVWYFSGSWVRVDTLKRFEGIAIKAPNPTALRLVENTQGGFNALPTHVRSLYRASSTSDWRVQIEARTPQMVDKENYFGVSADADEESDRYDLSEPPLLPGGVSLFFPHQEWKEKDIFTTDIRPERTDGYVWDYIIQTDVGSSIDLSFLNLESVPGEFESYLIDQDNHIAYDLIERRHFTTQAGSGLRRYRIIIGNEEFVHRQLHGFDLTPKSFSLSQNYPNPFLRTTTIRYELPVHGDVTIRIANIFGTELRQVVRNTHRAGYYEVQYDASELASGIYFVELTATGVNGEIFHAVKKMLVQR